MYRIALIVAAYSLSMTTAYISVASEPSVFNIQAHRCAGIALPENTLESAEWAWQHGVTPECDLRLTKDKQIVCFHDGNLGRVPSNADKKTKKLSVEKLSYDELKKLDVGSFRGKQYAGERIPLVSSLFAEMQGHPERMLYLDIKTVDMDQLAELVHKYGVEQQGIFTSTHYNLLQDWKKRIPESPTLLWNGGTEEELTKKLDEVRKSNFDGITFLQIHVHIKDLDKEEPFEVSTGFLRNVGKELKERGVVFQALPWDCSDPRAYEKLLELGAESFATDYPEVTLAAVKSFREKAAKQ
ncbi:MAG TPA: glycerophosphodiester phosphodiesterase family protein [Lacipirellulaceae bacterium]|nr:glycerophosphodiester phosphodiesterase family protein [Lacipirellulaceae bacterium]